MFQKKNIFLFFIIFINSVSGQNQDTTLIQLQTPEVTVTATKKEKELDKTPLPINLINYNDIIYSGAIRLDEILAKQTGVTITSTRTGTKGIQMQGLDASYTTILIDGFPLIGRSFGTLDLKRISIADIDRIEILRGASSSLYGSNSLSGVVNIISKDLSNCISSRL